MKLTRQDVAAIAACVAACNDDGVHDELVARLRALYLWVTADGLALPAISAKAGGERDPGSRPRAAGCAVGTGSGNGASPSAGAGLSYAEIEPLDRPEPGAPDTVVVDVTTVEAIEVGGRPLATATTDAIVSGGQGLADPDPQPHSRRRPRRTRAMGE